MFRKTTIFYLARGPITIIAVVVSLLFPFIKEYFTLYTILHLATANLGLIWVYRDLSTLIESAVRSGLNLALDKIVLDDLLRTIYDPLEGLWALFVGSYFGASLMYGLRMNEGQKTDLIQSSLGLRDESQAHSVFFEPGGCRAILPDNIQSWLQNSNKNKDEGNAVGEIINQSDITRSASSWCFHQSTDKRDFENDESVSNSDSVDTNSDNTNIIEESSSNCELKRIACLRKHNCVENKRKRQFLESKSQERQRGRPGGQGQADPMLVLFRIIQEMIQKKLKTCAEAIPQSKIENIGIAAAVAFGIQLALRRSTKKSLIVEYFCASIATVSFGTVLSREAFLGNIYDKQSMQTFGKDVASRMLNKIKKKPASHKSLFSMIVFFIVVRMKMFKKGGSANNMHFKR